MGTKEGKTVRFDAMVKASGAPEAVTLWTDPQKDRDFMKAVQEDRVVTVVQNNVGTAKDFGLVGFSKRENATFLVFPKPLYPSPDTKVVGIKYEKLAESKPKGPLHKPAAEPKPGVAMRESPPAKTVREEKPANKPASRKEQPPPKVYSFRADVELTAQQQVTVEVQATTAKEGARLLKARATELEFNLRDAKLSRKVGKVTKE